VVGHEDLVAGPEIERAKDRVHPGCRVGHEDEAVGVGPGELGDVAPRRGEPVRKSSGEEVDGLPLHLLPQPGLMLLDRPGTRPERAVIEVEDVGAERPEIAHPGPSRYARVYSTRIEQ
jgi:hypothetical protein